MIETIITSSILIFIILFLRLIFKKTVKPTIIYALWVIVALRLLLPFSLFESPASVMNIVPQPEIIFADNTKASIIEKPLNNAAAVKSKPAPDYFSFINLRFVWLSGVLLMALCYIYSNAVFTIKLYKTRRRIEHEGIPVYITDAVPTPCLYGIFRPCIYITPASLENKDLIICHELAHYKQRDYLIALVRCICVCIHWFNPLVWVASAVSGIDGEMACDERTIKTIGEEKRAQYGRLLIDMAASGSGSKLCLATSLAWDKKQLSQRIKHIARKPKNIIIAVAALAAIASVAMLVTFGSAKAAQENEMPSEEKIAAANGFLKNVFTAPNKLFTDNSKDVDYHLSQKYIADVCGDYVDKQKILGGGRLYDTVLYVQNVYSDNGSAINFNSAQISVSGNVYDYIANVTITTAKGIETDTEFIGLLQFNKDNKIDFFTAQPKDTRPYNSISFNDILSKHIKLDYTLPTFFELQPGLILENGEASTLEKRIDFNLSGDETIINKYKRKLTGLSNDENYYSRLIQAAFVVLKLCPDYDTVAFNLNGNINYEFTRNWAQDVFMDKWDMPVDTLQQFEEWFVYPTRGAELDATTNLQRVSAAVQEVNSKRLEEGEFFACGVVISSGGGSYFKHGEGISDEECMINYGNAAYGWYTKGEQINLNEVQFAIAFYNNQNGDEVFDYYEMEDGKFELIHGDVSAEYTLSYNLESPQRVQSLTSKAKNLLDTHAAEYYNAK